MTDFKNFSREMYLECEKNYLRFFLENKYTHKSEEKALDLELEILHMFRAAFNFEGLILSLTMEVNFRS